MMTRNPAHVPATSAKNGLGRKLAALAGATGAVAAGLSRLAAVVLLACAFGGATPSAHADMMQATVTWNSVSGTYGGTPFSNEPFSLTFGYDSASVTPFPSGGTNSQVNFPNGRNASGDAVRVSLGSILSNAAVDNVTANNIGMVSITNGIFVGNSTGTLYQNDRGSVRSFASTVPPSGTMLTTDWSAVGNSVLISQNFATLPLIINSLQLAPSSASGTGSVSVATVPEPNMLSLAAMALAALTGYRMRRQSWR